MNPLFGSLLILVFVAPPIGCIAVLLGMFLFQSKIDNETKRLVSLDRFTYSRDITIAYALFVLVFLASIIVFWTLAGSVSVSNASSFLIIQLGMARLANLGAKRLRDLGKPSWFCLLGCVPAVAHLFFLWLAFATPKGQISSE